MLKETIKIIIKHLQDCQKDIEQAYAAEIKALKQAKEARLLALQKDKNSKNTNPWDIDFAETFPEQPHKVQIATQYCCLLAAQQLLTLYQKKLNGSFSAKIIGCFSQLASSYTPFFIAARRLMEDKEAKQWTALFDKCLKLSHQKVGEPANDLSSSEKIENILLKHLLLLAKNPELFADLPKITLRGTGLATFFLKACRFIPGAVPKFGVLLEPIVDSLVKEGLHIINKFILPSMGQKKTGWFTEKKSTSEQQGYSNIYLMLLYSVYKVVYIFFSTNLPILGGSTIIEKSSQLHQKKTKLTKMVKDLTDKKEIDEKEIKNAIKAQTYLKKTIHQCTSFLESDIDAEEKRLTESTETILTAIETDIKTTGYLTPAESLEAAFEKLSALYTEAKITDRLLATLLKIFKDFFGIFTKEISTFKSKKTSKWIKSNSYILIYIVRQLPPQYRDQQIDAIIAETEIREQEYYTQEEINQLEHQNKDITEFLEGIPDKRKKIEKQKKDSQKQGEAIESKIENLEEEKKEKILKKEKNNIRIQELHKKLEELIRKRGYERPKKFPSKKEFDHLQEFFEKNFLQSLFSLDEKQKSAKSLLQDAKFLSAAQKISTDFMFILEKKDIQSETDALTQALSALITLFIENSDEFFSTPSRGELDKESWAFWKEFLNKDTKNILTILMDCWVSKQLSADNTSAIKTYISDLIMLSLKIEDRYSHPVNKQNEYQLTESEWKEVKEFWLILASDEVLTILMKLLQTGALSIQERKILHQLALDFSQKITFKEKLGKYWYKLITPVSIDFILDVIAAIHNNKASLFSLLKKVIITIFSTLPFILKTWGDIGVLSKQKSISKKDILPIIQSITTWLEQLSVNNLKEYNKSRKSAAPQRSKQTSTISLLLEWEGKFTRQHFSHLILGPVLLSAVSEIDIDLDNTWQQVPYLKYKGLAYPKGHKSNKRDDLFIDYFDLAASFAQWIKTIQEFKSENPAQCKDQILNVAVKISRGKRVYDSKTFDAANHNFDEIILSSPTKNGFSIAFILNSEIGAKLIKQFLSRNQGSMDANYLKWVVGFLLSSQNEITRLSCGNKVLHLNGATATRYKGDPLMLAWDALIETLLSIHEGFGFLSHNDMDNESSQIFYLMRGYVNGVEKFANFYGVTEREEDTQLLPFVPKKSKAVFLDAEEDVNTYVTLQELKEFSSSSAPQPKQWYVDSEPYIYDRCLSSSYGWRQQPPAVTSLPLVIDTSSHSIPNKMFPPIIRSIVPAGASIALINREQLPSQLQSVTVLGDQMCEINGTVVIISCEAPRQVELSTPKPTGIPEKAKKIIKGVRTVLRYTLGFNEPEITDEEEAGNWYTIEDRADYRLPLGLADIGPEQLDSKEEATSQPVESGHSETPVYSVQQTPQTPLTRNLPNNPNLSESKSKVEKSNKKTTIDKAPSEQESGLELGKLEYILLALSLLLGITSFCLLFFNIVSISLLPFAVFLAGLSLLQSALLIGGAVVIAGLLLTALQYAIRYACHRLSQYNFSLNPDKPETTAFTSAPFIPKSSTSLAPTTQATFTQTYTSREKVVTQTEESKLKNKT